LLREEKLKLDGESAKRAVKYAQLRCGNCSMYQGIEILNKMQVVACIAAPEAGGRRFGTVNFEQARKCPGSRKNSYDQLVAFHNIPPPDP
jgi:hypothetical protein